MNGAPLNIVHYLRTIRLAEGGVVRAVLDMCQLMAARRMNVTLITADAHDVPAEWRSSDEKHPHVVEIDPPTRLGRFPPATNAKLHAALQDADVIHLHTPWEISNLAMAAMARKRRVPYMVSVHGMLDDWSMKQRYWKKRVYLALFGRRFLQQAAGVHCTAEAEMHQAHKWCPAARPLVLPLLFDIAPFLKLPGPDVARSTLNCLASDKPNVLFLSRLHFKKGPEFLIDAAARLRDEGIATNVILAGPGDVDYVQTLRQRCSRLRLDGLVHFPGLITGDQKISLYEAADLFVLPTSQENFGLVLPEAMACRTPVVTTRGVDIWQELQSGGAVIVEQTAAAIADAIKRLLADKASLANLRRRGREFVFDWLEPGKVAQRYESAYRAMAQGGHRV